MFRNTITEKKIALGQSVENINFGDQAYETYWYTYFKYDFMTTPEFSEFMDISTRRVLSKFSDSVMRLMTITLNRSLIGYFGKIILTRLLEVNSC